MSDIIKRAESPDSPNRCQAVTAKGQCPNKAAKGQQYCQIHGGRDENHKKSYQLAKWRNRLDRFSESRDIKNLNDELGLLRMTLEALVNKCQDDNDLVMNQGAISNLVMNITKLITSTTAVEQKIGKYVDKKTILQFASEVIDIIATELADQPEKIEAIAERIASGFERSNAQL